MRSCLSQSQFLKLTQVLINELDAIDVTGKNSDSEFFDNFELLDLFLSAKKVEGCSLKTIKYYKSTIEKLLVDLDKSVDNIFTDDLRNYLSQYKNAGNVSKTTVDNLRRIFSSFFSWLEDENYILKNPVKRIHRVKKGRVVKETLSDEEIETLRDNCDNLRDLGILDLLVSTGMRVGELVSLNIADINFEERECVVFW